MDIKKTIRMNELFDFYQLLLTDKQRDYMIDYYLEDFSLAEIAEKFAVSRQAVYDNIRRTGALLESYEQCLQLREKFYQRKEQIERLKKLENLSGLKAIVSELEALD